MNKRILLIFFLLTLILFRKDAFAQNSTNIAILPFNNTTQNISLDWLKDGIAETLSTKLSVINSLKIVERIQTEKIMKELAFSNSGFAKESLKLGELLSAQYIVLGDFQLQGEMIKFQARLVKSETGQIINSVEVHGNKDNILFLQDELAEKLIIKLLPPSAKNVLKQKKESLDFKSYRYFNQAKMIVSQVSQYILEPMRRKNESKYLQAIDYLENVLETNPNYPEVYVLLGRLYLNLEQDDKALSCFNKAIELSPEYSDAYFNLGTYYKIKRNYSTALDYFEKAIINNPKNASAYYGAAVSSHYIKSKNLSIYYIFKALEFRPDFIEAELFLGSVLQDSDYQGWVGQNFSLPGVSFFVFLSELNNKNKVLEENTFLDAVKYFPSLYKIYYYRGMSDLKNGNQENAIINFKKVMSLFPTNPDNNYALGNLYHKNDCLKSIPYYQNYLNFSKQGNDFGEINQRIQNCMKKEN